MCMGEQHLYGITLYICYVHCIYVMFESQCINSMYNTHAHRQKYMYVATYKSTHIGTLS